jgi:hypothetical protein
MIRWLYLRKRKLAASTSVVVAPNNMPDTVLASQTDGRVRRPTNPTPLAIRKAQEALPELQQGDFLKTFAGRKVSWPLVVVSVFKLEEEFCTLVLKYEVPELKLMVGCLAHVTDYPILKVVQPGHKLWATGEIYLITVNSILLKDVVLEFDTVTDAKMAEAAHECGGKGIDAAIEPRSSLINGDRSTGSSFAGSRGNAEPECLLLWFHETASSDGKLFERRLLERTDGTLIESRCRHCGQILLGKAIFGDLLEQEQQHMLQCGRK